jgi:excisionase family DNA binding protein
VGRSACEDLLPSTATPNANYREDVKVVTSEEPVVLTVEEAARLLRIGRSAAYEQARRFIATGGAEGLPAVRLGRRLRVPRQALSRMLALGGEAGDVDR